MTNATPAPANENEREIDRILNRNRLIWDRTANAEPAPLV